MLTYGLPILFALFTWWFLTGAVLYVVGLPRSSVRWSMTIASGVLLAALAVIWQTSSDTSTGGAYLAFAAAIFVWGWHELSFLTGVVTGPRTTEAPFHRKGRAGFWPAVETLIYHELAILVTAAALAVMLAGADNQVALWTFVILWVMRVSAKLNVYLGVPNLTEEFLPEHLTYLKSYFCRRPMNLLFPVSVSAGSGVTVLLVLAAADPAATAFEATGFTFLATLLGLAVVEHWFLVVPLPSAQLWSWGLWSRPEASGAQTCSTTVALARRPGDVEPPCPVSASIF